MKAALAVLLTLAALAIGAFFFFSESWSNDFNGERDSATIAEEEVSEDLESGAQNEDASEGDAAREASAEISASETKEPEEIVLRVAGRLIDANGQGIAGCKVDLRYRNSATPLMFYQLSPKAKFEKSVTSGADGSFEFGLPKRSGGVLVLDSDEWIFPKHSGFDRSVRDIQLGDLPCVKAAQIRGTVRGAIAFKKASIALQQTRDNQYRNENFEAGSFVVKRLVPGPYTVTVNASKHLGTKRSLTLQPGEVHHGFDVHLKLGMPLSGRVVDDTGAGIADAHVSAYSHEQWKIKEGDFVHDSTKTDANGHFTLEGADDGKIQLHARKKNHSSARKSAKRSDGPQTLTLKRKASIAGSLRLTDGTPLAGSRLVARRVTQEGKKKPAGRSARFATVMSADGDSFVTRLGASASSTKSKKDGSFELSNLEPGRYVVVATGEHLEVQSTALELARGDAHKGLELTTELGAEARVLVLDSTGKPVRSALVEAEVASARAARMAAAKKKKTTTNSQPSIGAADVSFVTDSSSSFLVPSSFRSGGKGKAAASAKTDESGVATLRGLRSGESYVFTAKSPDIVGAESGVTEVSSETVVEVTVHGKSGGFVTVRVVDAWGKAAAGVPFKISPIDDKKKKESSPGGQTLFRGGIRLGGSLGRNGKTDANGQATVGPLVPGKYEVKSMKSASSGSYWLSAPASKNEPGEPFEIRAGETSEVTIRAPKSITLKGVLTDNGRPLGSKQVYLMRHAKHGAWSGMTMTAADGSFVMRGVEPGEYSLGFSESATYDTDALKLDVQDAPAIQTRNFALQSRSITVHVTDEEGKAIKGASLYVARANMMKGLEALMFTNQSFGNLKTDKNGDCEVHLGRSVTNAGVVISSEGFAKRIVDKLEGRIDVQLSRGAQLRIGSGVSKSTQIQIRRQGSKAWHTSRKTSLIKARIMPGTYEYRSRVYERSGPSGRRTKKPWSAIRTIQVSENAENELITG